MARDYKSRAAPRSKTKKAATPGWVWFLAGLVVGLFACGLAWLKLAPEGSPGLGFARKSAPVVDAKPATRQAESASPSKDPAPKPRFDFYTILPEMEVVVPDPEPEPVPAVPANGAAPVVSAEATAAGSGARYMLQMGSFRKYGDADRLKASLALVGLVAEIQKVSLDGGEVYHRVRSGPYTSGQVNALRGKLKQNNISSLVIKLRQ